MNFKVQAGEEIFEVQISKPQFSILKSLKRVFKDEEQEEKERPVRSNQCNLVN